MNRGAEHIEARIRAAESDGRIALMPYVVTGHPSIESFPEILEQVAGEGR